MGGFSTDSSDQLPVRSLAAWAALAGAVVLGGCGESSSLDAETSPSSSSIPTLDCGRYDDMEGAIEAAPTGPPGSDPDPQIAVQNFAEREGLTSDGTRDLEVSEALWRRIEDEGRVLYEFRVEHHPDGSWYVQGLRRCSPHE